MEHEAAAAAERAKIVAWLRHPFHVGSPSGPVFARLAHIFESGDHELGLLDRLYARQKQIESETITIRIDDCADNAGNR